MGQAGCPARPLCLRLARSCRKPRARAPGQRWCHLLGLCRRRVGGHDSPGVLRAGWGRRAPLDAGRRVAGRDGGSARARGEPGRLPAPDHRARVTRRKVLAICCRGRHPHRSGHLPRLLPRLARRDPRRPLRLRGQLQPAREDGALVGVGGLHPHQHRGGAHHDVHHAARQPSRPPRPVALLGVHDGRPAGRDRRRVVRRASPVQRGEGRRGPARTGRPGTRRACRRRHHAPRLLLPHVGAALRRWHQDLRRLQQGGRDPRGGSRALDRDPSLRDRPRAVQPCRHAGWQVSPGHAQAGQRGPDVGPGHRRERHAGGEFHDALAWRRGVARLPVRLRHGGGGRCRTGQDGRLEHCGARAHRHCRGRSAGERITREVALPEGTAAGTWRLEILAGFGDERDTLSSTEFEVR